MSEIYYPNPRQKLAVHSADQCAGQTCVIHNPTDHHMRRWTLMWRGDRNCFERICPEHGVGHPDPDDRNHDGVHGCCGCCRPPEPNSDDTTQTPKPA